MLSAVDFKYEFFHPFLSHFYEQVEISHKFKEWNYTFGYINYKAL